MVDRQAQLRREHEVVLLRKVSRHHALRSRPLLRSNQNRAEQNNNNNNNKRTNKNDKPIQMYWYSHTIACVDWEGGEGALSPACVCGIEPPGPREGMYKPLF